MKLFKKAASLILGFCAAFTFIFTAACSYADDEKNTIVCTIFPQYDWVMEILGDNADGFEVVLLTESGVDMHNYQVSASDIVTIKYAELFIYVGGESDEWVEDAITSSKTEAVTLALLDEVDAVEEEYKEGMEPEDEDGEEDGETEYDEHVWLSLKNARTLVNVIAEKICEIDPENADTYVENAAAYIAELDELDGEYETAVQSATYKTLVFADRFPFKYMVDDYGLDYYAAFKGCSAQETASASTITFLAQKLIDENLKHVMVIETSDQSIAKTVINTVAGLGGDNSGMDILVLNSCQSVTASDIAAGASYLKIMQSNLEALKTALN